MRGIALWLGLAGVLGAQSIAEVGAAAAGGATGAAAGKTVSDGMTKIFGKVDQKAASAAKPDAAKPEAAKADAPKQTKPDVAADAERAPAASGTRTVVAQGPAGGSGASRGADPSDSPAASRAKTFRKRPEAAERTSSQSDGSLVPPPPPVQHAAMRRPVEAPAPPVQPVPPPPPAEPIAVPPPDPVTIEELRAITAGTNRDDVLKLGPPSSRITMFDDGHLAETFRYTDGDTMLGVVRLSDGVVAAVELR